MKKWIALLLTAVLFLQLAACAAPAEEETGLQVQAVNWMEAEEAYEAEPTGLAALDFEPGIPTAEFALSLLENSLLQEENLVLSPYSALLVLAMAANGADGATLEEMEELFGMSCYELNSYLYLARRNAREELTAAASIWIREEEGFAPEEAFLTNNGIYHDGDVFTAPFDESTVEEMNAWVRRNTRDRIEGLIDSIGSNTMVYLLSALAFDGVWTEAYEASALFDSSFTAADGTVQSVTMMQSEEQIYLEDDLATGFIKPYENNYSFVALLPNEGVTVEEYIASLNGEQLMHLLQEGTQTTVHAVMPRLETECSIDLSTALQNMGMESAFGEGDFSRIHPTRPLNISKIFQQTALTVDETGTQAASASGIEIVEKSAPMGKYVVLDRPYVMAIVDNSNGMLLFLGVINQVNPTGK